MSRGNRRDTDIHGKDGFFRQGEKIGHATAERRIRKRDGFFRGEEIGSVDSDGTIRGKDGFLFRGKAVGQVRDKNAYDKDGLLFRGEVWGYVDADGNVRQRDGMLFRGRVIGKAKGSAESALGFFVLRFQGIADKVRALEEEIGTDARKGRFLARVRKMLEWVPKADALGDFDGLIRRLQRLERVCSEELKSNEQKKRDLIGRAKQLASSTDWKTAGERLKALQQEWKQVQSGSRENEEALWNQFRAAIDSFYERRKQHFDKLSRDREANYAKKEQLISSAKSIASSTDWKAAGERLKNIQGEWKRIGPVPKEKQEAQWNRFRAALDGFYDARKKHFDKLNRDREANYAKKEQLISRAKSIASSTDWKTAGERLKSLQEEWKGIGPVPKEKQEGQWNRFRAALDGFYDARKKHFDKLNRDRQANANRKESLIRRAEELSRSTDFKGASEAMRDLQAQWKAVGPVPREQNDALWSRFRAAQDRFFQSRKQAYDRRQAEWQSRTRDVLNRKREQASRLSDSIAHDKNNVSRWQDQIYSIRPGRRADEIRSSLESKIDSVEAKIRSKESRLADLESAIRDIESKLR